MGSLVLPRSLVPTCSFLVAREWSYLEQELDQDVVIRKHFLSLLHMAKVEYAASILWPVSFRIWCLHIPNSIRAKKNKHY